MRRSILRLVCSSTALLAPAMLIGAPSTSFADANRQLARLDASFSRSSTSAGPVYVGPTASDEVVRILALGFSLEELTDDSASGPIVVGPADLDLPWIVAKLELAYDTGFAVAVTNADVPAIDHLHDLLLHRGSAHPAPGVKRVRLAAFRKAERPDGQLNYSSHLLLPRAGEAPRTIKPLPRRGANALRRLPRLFAGGQHGHDEADRSELQGLQRIFADTPELPAPPPPADSPQQNLLELADSYQFHAIRSDQFGDSVQLVNSVWAARSFMNSTDLYYVLQETDYHVVDLIVLGDLNYRISKWTNTVGNLAIGLNGSPTLIGPSPQTTMEATQDISGVSYTIGGSVGWNQTQGLNASVSGSVTISNQKETTIPPIDITNDADLEAGRPIWSYEVNELPSQPETIDLFSQWIWSVPFADYEPSQTELRFSSGAGLDAEFEVLEFVIGTNFLNQMVSSVPMPFGQTFTLQPPVITGVSPSCVEPGQSFSIDGTALYPSLVQAVLIGGTPVSQTNITTISDTQVDVIAPDTDACRHDTGCPAAVQTSEGTSNTSVSVVIKSSCG